MKNYNYTITMGNLSIIAPRNKLDCCHLTFSALIPFSIVAPLILDDEEMDLERMIQCKSLFDMEIMRCRNV